MPSLEKKITEIIKGRRVLGETSDASGAQEQGGTHVKPTYTDLGAAVVSPTQTEHPDYTKGTPSQTLRKGGSQEDHKIVSDISNAHADKDGKISPESDSADKTAGGGPKLKPGKEIQAETINVTGNMGIQEAAKKILKKFNTESALKEDSGADKDNQRQYDKRADADSMKHVDGQKDVKEAEVPKNMPGGGMQMTDTGNELPPKSQTVSEEGETVNEKLKGLPRIKRGSRPFKAEIGSAKAPAQVSHIKENEDDKKDMEEDINALFAGEQLTEAFKKKAVVIFETAVNMRVNSIVEQREEEITEDLTKQMEDAVEEITEILALRVDKYLNYISEEWVKENEVNIENTLRPVIAEDFMNGLKELFERHYIEIPKNKVDVVETLAKRVEELEEQLNQTIETNVSISEENKNYKKAEIFYEVAEGLADSQVDKLQTLAESVEFKNADSFKQSLNILRESNFAKEQTPRGINLTEDKTSDKPIVSTTIKNNEMAAYKNAIIRRTS